MAIIEYELVLKSIYQKCLFWVFLVKLYLGPCDVFLGHLDVVFEWKEGRRPTTLKTQFPWLKSTVGARCCGAFIAVPGTGKCERNLLSVLFEVIVWSSFKTLTQNEGPFKAQVSTLLRNYCRSSRLRSVVENYLLWVGSNN